MRDDQRNLGGMDTGTGGDIGQAADQVKNAAGQAAQQAQQAAAPLTEQVQQTAGQVAEQAKQQAAAQVSTQKEHAAGSLDAVAQALRQSGEQLRGNQQEPLANLAGVAAQHVEQFSGYLRNTDVRAMVHDVEQFARQQPAAFLGGAFTLGVLAARFLKSSSQPAAETTTAAPGRMPSYSGYSATPYATSGTSRYPAPPPYRSVSSGTAGSSPSTTGLGQSSVIPPIDQPVAGTMPPRAGGGATGAGWGYTPRSGSTSTEREGR